MYYQVHSTKIKSTTFVRGRAYTCKLVGPKHEAYEEGVLDFYAVYLGPVDLWYILPYEAARKTSVSFQFTPTREGHKYEKYLEAWHFAAMNVRDRAGRTQRTHDKGLESVAGPSGNPHLSASYAEGWGTR